MAGRRSGGGPRRGCRLIDVAESSLPGVYVIEPQRHDDERGSFARLYCRREYAEHGIDFEPVQISVSTNKRRDTLRGLHFQAPPAAEGKVVICMRGTAFDVVVDLRTESATYGRWTSFELSAEHRRAVYVPPGCAHGFQTRESDTELVYLISEFYDASLQRGVRWSDPALGIDWPAEPSVISERDRAFTDFPW